MSEDHTAEREAFEAWYSAEDQETDDPERTYELTEEGMNELTKYCVWQGWQARAAAPAQERIQALELEVRQLTEQIAGLRHAPTPQADSQPAPSTDQVEEILRERDDAEDFIDVLLDEVLGHERPEWSSAYGRADALNDVQERMTALHKPAVDKAWDQFQSAMAADSVLEDAARLDWLLLHISGAEFRRIGVHYSGNARRADVDAARKQGANHD